MDNSNYKILIVDDEPDIKEFLGYNLKKEGFQISLAKNGIEALKTAKEIKPHLILLDVMMPEMDGIETCEELRKIDGLNNILDADFIDTFRFKKGDEIKYSWWSYRAGARKKNIGWRIDYFFVSPTLAGKIQDADILTEIPGSDHCPIVLDLTV